MNNNNCGHAGSFVMGMMFGMVVGGALGVLYAPKPGRETRKILIQKGKVASKKLKKGIDQLKEEAEEIKERAGKAYKAAEKELKA